MFRALCVALSFLAPAAFVPSLASSADTPKVGNFRAGAFVMDATPQKLPIDINGSMNNHQATSVHDPINARCIVLDDGKTKAAIVTVDSCLIPRELMDSAKAKAEKATGIPASNILISATHTHSAPAVWGVFQTDANEEYAKFLADKIAEGITKAHANLAPAKAGWGSVKEPTQVFNRRWKMKEGFPLPDPFGGIDRVKMNPPSAVPELIEPAGPTDPDVSVLSIHDAKDRPLALHANYSLHYVGGFPALSADYFGVFSERIGSLIGADAAEPKFVGALSNGTSGDVNNVNFRQERTRSGEKIRLVAETVAEAAKKAHDAATHKGDITIAVAEKEIELGVRKPKPDEIERAKKILAETKPGPLKSREEIYARETMFMSKYPDTVKAKLMAIRIGDLGIAAIPCETFTDIGLDIKKKSPLAKTFTISLANGYNGYLPTPAHHALGGYETWRARSSYLEVPASDKITATILELLNTVAKK